MDQVPEDSPYLIIGKIGSTYGTKGWIKITSYTEVIAQILDYRPWYIEDANTWKPIEIEKSQLHGKGIIIKFTGFDSPEQARLLNGKNIAIQRSQLPKLAKNEYYWSDLKGLTVIDQNGHVLGKVIYLIETGSNDVLVIKGKKEYAIPYLLGKVITDVDLAKSEMRVNWEVI